MGEASDRRLLTCVAVQWLALPVLTTKGGGGGGMRPVEFRGSGPYMFCICVCLSRQLNYLSIAQNNPLRPSPSHSATENQPFRLSVKLFSRSARKKIFHRGSNPLSAAMGAPGFTLRPGDRMS